MRISVVIPTFNEERGIAAMLASIVGSVDEVIVVDGGSQDRTREIVQAIPNVKLLDAPRGRGSQLAHGAEAATGDILWFLHADTHPDPLTPGAIRGVGPEAAGGNCSLRFSGSSFGARFLNHAYPLLRWLRLYYGDSGIFVRREAYRATGGFRPEHPLFEDIDLIRRLRRHGRFLHLDAGVTTSSRRFEKRWFPGMFAHWTLLQVLYWLGAPPHVLGRWYGAVR